MYSHDDIWRAIDRLAAAFGYSPSGLAKKAGLDPTTFNKSKRVSSDGKPRWPSTESLSKILAVTGMTLTDFFSMTDSKPGRGASKDAASSAKLPIIGIAQAGRDGYFDNDGFPVGSWEHVTFPTAGRHADDDHLFALEVTGQSMEPLYRENDIIVLSPQASLRRGDRVVVKTTGGEIMAKELIRRSTDKTELRSLNADHANITLKSADISWIARIIWVSQ